MPRWGIRWIKRLYTRVAIVGSDADHFVEIWTIFVDGVALPDWPPTCQSVSTLLFLMSSLHDGYDFERG